MEPCFKCLNPVGSVHKCEGCGKQGHVFCFAKLIGEEGFGQKGFCARCMDSPKIRTTHGLEPLVAPRAFELNRPDSSTSHSIAFTASSSLPTRPTTPSPLPRRPTTVGPTTAHNLFASFPYALPRHHSAVTDHSRSLFHKQLPQL
jgi:hypothetical protein